MATSPVEEVVSDKLSLNILISFINRVNCYFIAEWYDANTVKFFYKHPSLTWVPACQSNITAISGAIGVQSPFGIMQVGRINLKYPNGTFTQIGKIWQGALYHINTGGVEVSTTGPYEVLICSSASG